MNPEHEIGSGQTDISPLAKLEVAIQDYLTSLGDERVGAGGILTGWVLVTEEQNPVSGTSSLTRTVRDLQSFITTLGLATYLEKYYASKVTDNR